MADRWILTRLNETVARVTGIISMVLNLVKPVDNCITFIWDDFCDWYIEI